MNGPVWVAALERSGQFQRALPQQCGVDVVYEDVSALDPSPASRAVPEVRHDV